MRAPGLDEEILSILEGKDDEVVASVVPWILLGAMRSADPASLPEQVQVQLAELFGALGLTASTTEEELNDLLARWPRPDEGLVREINRALRERLRAGKTGDAAFGAALGAVIGSDRVQGALERTAPPPEGAVAGGPLARFAALGVTKKSD
jgi:hypothetical protein